MSETANHKAAPGEDSDDGVATITKTSVTIIQQLECCLRGLSNDQYTFCPEGQTSTIGQHVRHVAEFYQAFLDSAETGEGCDLCYDDRQRSTLLQSSKDVVIHELKSIRQRLTILSHTSRTLKLWSIIEPSKPMIGTETNLAREAIYLLDHMIHHMALIKMIARDQGIILDRCFGRAQSTIAHEDLAY